MEKHKVEGSIKKGPWTAEEDQVLINFVNRYGPKDWSSIRSLGLLPRTGKSCRLRWVNKLRPNLKVGCKFTEEEENVVIDLQERYGNKWATIAKYLTGRTDNDVKNFWSSRKKRLTRTNHSPSTSHKSSQKQKGKAQVVPYDGEILPLQEIRFNSIKMEETTPIKMEETTPPSSSSQMLCLMPPPDLLPTHIPFTDQYHGSNPISDATLIPLLSDHHDSAFDLFGTHKVEELDDMSQLSLDSEFKLETLPDTFFGELPADMFDCLEPNPSLWSNSD